jgi:NAD(P)-dependent dehydrogenase (short-subunit alcohol dehydrogenase family)
MYRKDINSPPYSPGDYLSQFTTNVFGTINVTRAFLPHFRKRREGVIVNIGSMAAWETYPAVGAYCASKAALRCKLILVQGI